MDTLTAYYTKTIPNRGKEMKCFDWEKAAQIIKERKPQEADAGLLSDYEWTRDTIYSDGKANLDTQAFLESIWATPMLILDDLEEIECWRMESKLNWKVDEKWPQTALKILES